MKAHNPGPLPVGKRSARGIPWLACQRCGLVYLKNAATQAAARAPCPGDEDAAEPQVPPPRRGRSAFALR